MVSWKFEPDCQRKNSRALTMVLSILEVETVTGLLVP